MRQVQRLTKTIDSIWPVSTASSTAIIGPLLGLPLKGHRHNPLLLPPWRTCNLPCGCYDNVGKQGRIRNEQYPCGL